VGLDCGIDLEGYYSDAAITLPIGKISEEADRLMRVTRECLDRAIAAIKPGIRIHDISRAVFAHATANGYGVVRQYCGHGVGFEAHEDPQVPNYVSTGPNPRIVPGMVLAIEPMINLGKGDVKVLDDEWTVVTLDKKISAHDVMELMRDHYEGTKMDMTNDIGAGPYACPYRWRPMTWQVDSVPYVHERAVSTQQTGFVFVAQSRSWLPDWIGGIHWFGVDDTFTTVFSPMYCGITKVPKSFAEGNGSMLKYSPTSAFWAFNFVANWAYTRYNSMIKDIQPVQRELELKYTTEVVNKIDKEAQDLFKKDKNKARAYLTSYSVKTGNATVTRWQELGHYLLVKYLDGNIKKEKDGKFLDNGTGQAVMPNQPGYPQWWLKEIVREHGEVIKGVK
ncbi:MAG: type I methionyl aminopeptidase, partial [Bacteroidota bacterium]